jgi:hypothetical protein
MKLATFKEAVARQDNEQPHLKFILKEVPSGWIVIVSAVIEGMVNPIGVTFVPDADHKWRGLELEETGPYLQ